MSFYFTATSTNTRCKTCLSLTKYVSTFQAERLNFLLFSPGTIQVSPGVGGCGGGNPAEIPGRARRIRVNGKHDGCKCDAAVTADVRFIHHISFFTGKEDGREDCLLTRQTKTASKNSPVVRPCQRYRGDQLRRFAGTNCGVSELTQRRVPTYGLATVYRARRARAFFLWHEQACRRFDLFLSCRTIANRTNGHHAHAICSSSVPYIRGCSGNRGHVCTRFFRLTVRHEVERNESAVVLRCPHDHMAEKKSGRVFP